MSLKHKLFESRAAYVERIIKAAILEGIYPPGEVLSQEKLADELGVSRTPIREALLNLERDGFVKIEPCVGTIVNHFQPKDLLDIYTIRFELEPLAIRLAFNNIGPREIEKLRANIAESQSRLEAEDFIGSIELNREFHRMIYQYSNNDYLMQILTDLSNKLVCCATTHAIVCREINIEAHSKILEAIEKGEKQQACEIMRLHLEHSMESAMETLANNSQF